MVVFILSQKFLVHPFYNLFFLQKILFKLNKIPGEVMVISGGHLLSGNCYLEISRHPCLEDALGTLTPSFKSKIQLLCTELVPLRTAVSRW